MPTSYTNLLGLALPVQGELDGTWGDTVNDFITKYLDTAIAGALTVSTDVTLTRSTGATLGATSSQYAVIVASGHTANITITAPASSKIYAVINTSPTFTVRVRGAGPTTGVVIGASDNALVAWSGTDFVRVGGADNSNTVQTFTNKTINLANNTLLGTVAQFNTALTDGDFATLAGAETLTNKTVAAATFTDGYTEETFVSNTGSAFTINLANGTVQVLTLNANCTFTFPTATAGRSFLILLKQDATGNRTVTWPAVVKWPSGVNPTITPTANKLDKYAFVADGTNWFGTNAGQNY